MMKWATYLIRHKDSEAGKDVYVGHSAYVEGKLGKILKKRLKKGLTSNWLRNVAEETKLDSNSTNEFSKLVQRTGKLNRLQAREQALKQKKMRK